MDINKINLFYNSRLNLKTNYSILSWNTKESQESRLKKIYSYCDGKILDYGCGLGDLINICDIEKNNYLGVDINENFINLCKSNHPEYEFKLIENYKIEEFGEFDWWLACGLFTIGNTDEELIEILNFFLNKTKKGLILNLFEGDERSFHRGYDIKNIISNNFNNYEIIDIRDITKHNEKLIIIRNEEHIC